jgi:hypothetical protein
MLCKVTLGVLKGASKLNVLLLLLLFKYKGLVLHTSFFAKSVINGCVVSEWTHETHFIFWTWLTHPPGFTVMLGVKQ